MLSALLAGALIAAASLFAGAAIMAAVGRPRHSAAVPVVGLSALLVVCGIAIKLPGHGTTAAVAVGLSLGTSAWVLHRPARGERRRDVPLGAVLAVAGAALLVSIPFLTSGRIGIMGQGLVNDDMASHLLFTEWADTREGTAPDLIQDGYPLGPHALVSATERVVPGADLIETFAGLTGAIAVLAALTAYGALASVRPLFRGPAAVLAAMPYLGAAYLAQGAFKEPMLGLALVGFALCLPALRGSWDGKRPSYVSTIADRGPGWMRSQAKLAVPAGVIAAGTIYNYSFPGLAWLVLAVLAWALIAAWRVRDERNGLDLRSRVRCATPVLVAGCAIPVLLSLPELPNLIKFAGFEAFNPTGEGGNTGFGNLRQPLNPLEALGVWPSSEFRIAPKNSSTPEIAFYLGGLLGLAAAAWGLGRALARRETALPAALAAAAVGYLAALAVGTPYTQAKSLAVAAPVVMLITLRGLLAADPLEDEGEPAGVKEATWWPPAPLRPLVRFGVPLLAAAFTAAALFSTLLPLRQSAVGPGYHVDELKSFRPVLDGDDVLFLGRDNFISWELLGSEVYTPIRNPYDTEPVWSLYRATPINAKFDWDNVPPDLPDDRRSLADFDWVITTSAMFNSEAPPEFAVAERTRDFVLWQRRGAGDGDRRTLREPIYPGATVNCANSDVSGLGRLDGNATVFPVAPVIGKAWEPSPDITEAGAAVEELLLRPGRWGISIQYASTQQMVVSAPRFRQVMRANLLFRGPAPYYPAGVLRVNQPKKRDSVPARRDELRPIRFTVEVDGPPNAIADVFGTESRAYLGRIAATRLGPRSRIPLRRACGRYLDWYAAPGATPAQLEGIEAPTPEPPDEE
ncbi:MAG: hypothetical protein K0S15_1265 [Solirubrobacterales bacterium]|nr:hypothetical protein [Solirubrobacterales bacterium]